MGSSIAYRVAVGSQQGQKVFMIRTIQPLNRPDPGLQRVARANGFSLHTGVDCEGYQKDKRERLCRYIARPAVAIARLAALPLEPVPLYSVPLFSGVGHDLGAKAQARLHQK